MKNTKYLLIFYFLYSYSCSKGVGNNGIEYHPFENRIPYFENNHIAVDKINNYSKEYLVKHPFYDLNQINLNSYKNSKKLDLVSVVNADRLHIIALDQNRLVILQNGIDHLVEYNLETNEVYEIAKFGRGPGSIAYSQDIIEFNGSLYVSTLDMRISVFQCIYTPCKFKESIPLKGIIPKSLAIASNQIAIFGFMPISGNNISEKEDSLMYNAVTILNDNRELVSKFGSVYEYKNDWLLLNSYGDGFVRFDHNLDVFIVAFKWFPLIYIYDKYGNLIKSYRVMDFLIGSQKYEIETRKLHIVHEDHSMISDIKTWGESHLIVTIKTLSERRVVGSQLVWVENYDYYLIDLTNDKIYYIESISSGDKVFFTKYGLIFFRNHYLNFYKINS